MEGAWSAELLGRCVAPSRILLWKLESSSLMLIIVLHRRQNARRTRWISTVL